MVKAVFMGAVRITWLLAIDSSSGQSCIHGRS